MTIDPLVICDGSCESTECEYFWYVQECYWKRKFKDCNDYIWLGFRVIGNTSLTIVSRELRIERNIVEPQRITTICEDNIKMGNYLRVSNKEFFEVYKQLRKNS